MYSQTRARQTHTHASRTAESHTQGGHRRVFFLAFVRSRGHAAAEGGGIVGAPVASVSNVSAAAPNASPPAAPWPSASDVVDPALRTRGSIGRPRWRGVSSSEPTGMTWVTFPTPLVRPSRKSRRSPMRRYSGCRRKRKLSPRHDQGGQAGKRVRCAHERYAIPELGTRPYRMTARSPVRRTSRSIIPGPSCVQRPGDTIRSRRPRPLTPTVRVKSNVRTMPAVWRTLPAWSIAW